MPEVTDPGEHHRDAMCIRGGDVSGITFDPPGCTTAVTPAFARRLDAISEREDASPPTPRLCSDACELRRDP